MNEIQTAGFLFILLSQYLLTVSINNRRNIDRLVCFHAYTWNSLSSYWCSKSKLNPNLTSCPKYVILLVQLPTNAGGSYNER